MSDPPRPAKRHLEPTAEHTPQRYADAWSWHCARCGFPWPCLPKKLEVIELMRVLDNQAVP